MKYKVCYEKVEARTGADEVWTKEDYEADYHNRGTLEPITLESFDNYAEAKKYFDNTPADPEYRERTNTGWVLFYEVVYIEEVVEENGEEVEWLGWTDQKWSEPKKFEEND